MEVLNHSRWLVYLILLIILIAIVHFVLVGLFL